MSDIYYIYIYILYKLKNKVYLGASETSFKLDSGNHKNLENICPIIKIQKSATSVRTSEKYRIAMFRGDILLNKRNEIIRICRHRTKYKLINCDKNEWYPNLHWCQRRMWDTCTI